MPAASWNRSPPSPTDSPEISAPIGVTMSAGWTPGCPPPITPGISHKGVSGAIGHSRRTIAPIRLAHAIQRKERGESVTTRAYVHDPRKSIEPTTIAQ